MKIRMILNFSDINKYSDDDMLDPCLLFYVPINEAPWILSLHFPIALWLNLKLTQEVQWILLFTILSFKSSFNKNGIYNQMWKSIMKEFIPIKYQTLTKKWNNMPKEINMKYKYNKWERGRGRGEKCKLRVGQPCQHPLFKMFLLGSTISHIINSGY